MVNFWMDSNGRGWIAFKPFNRVLCVCHACRTELPNDLVFKEEVSLLAFAHQLINGRFKVVEPIVGRNSGEGFSTD
jgi:hypothetical protein